VSQISSIYKEKTLSICIILLLESENHRDLVQLFLKQRLLNSGLSMQGFWILNTVAGARRVSILIRPNRDAPTIALEME